jgi:hypothetical protein
VSPCLYQFVSRMRPTAVPQVLLRPIPDGELPHLAVLVAVGRAMM